MSYTFEVACYEYFPLHKTYQVLPQCSTF